MAGIVGLILKESPKPNINYIKIFKLMMNKLAFAGTQKRKDYSNDRYHFGNIVPVSSENNDHFQFNRKLKIYVVVDGLVFINNDIRRILASHYHIDPNSSDYVLLPFLYHLFKGEFIEHLTGGFNIFIYDEKENNALLINDRLGLLPIYYYNSDLYFIFASKIESILVSGLLPSIAFDYTTILEHLLYHHTLTDNTYIENIKTLSNAESISISQNKVVNNKYWTIGKLFGYKPVNDRISIELMNAGIKKSIEKITKAYHRKLNLSFTAGWDSRVVLSYFLPDLKDKLHLYSFGANDADDILIPKSISGKEGIDYTSYLLDDYYLNNHFIENAMLTIMLSNGTRNYKRTHYLFAIQQLSDISDIAIMGIFGDEIFKIAQIVPGTVLADATLDLINTNFDVKKSLLQLKNSGLLNILNINSKQIVDQFAARIELLKNSMDNYNSKSKKYYSMRFEINLRKYFGNELNSYNDFVYGFSPFIDYNFLENFAQTKYFGINFPFNSNNMLLKRMSTRLYYTLTNENYKPLVSYITNRGYNMKDSSSILGNLKIILTKKILSKIDSKDDFNTNNSTKIFASLFSKYRDDLALNINNLNEQKNAPDIYSLYFWLDQISKTYH